MIAFIKGTLMGTSGDHVVLENHGIGYKIFMPSAALFKLPSVGEELKVHTYLYVREDAMQLYGFLEKEELELFEILLQVSGIGPKGAVTILSAVPAASFVQAIVNEQLDVLVKIPGIGKKTAQRMIIELKDKLAKVMVVSKDSPIPVVSSAGSGEAVQALVALGYAANETKKAVNKVLADNPGLGVEDIIKKALLELARF